MQQLEILKKGAIGTRSLTSARRIVFAIRQGSRGREIHVERVEPVRAPPAGWYLGKILSFSSFRLHPRCKSLRKWITMEVLARAGRADTRRQNIVPFSADAILLCN
jgi:hypothetical protein